MFTPLQVAKAVKAAGMPVKRYLDGDCDQEDGHVQITKKTHIQVGEDYLSLVRVNEHGMLVFLHDTGSLPNMIYFIRTLFIQGKI